MLTVYLRMRIDCTALTETSRRTLAPQEPQGLLQGVAVVPVTSNQPQTVVTTGRQGETTGMILPPQECQAVIQEAAVVPVTSNQTQAVFTTGAQGGATGLMPALQEPQAVVQGTAVIPVTSSQSQAVDRTGAQEEATGALASQDSQAVQRAAVAPVTSSQPQAAVATTGSGGVDVENGDLPSPQQVLNLVALKYFQVNNPSTQEELNGFIEYMETVRQVIIVDAQPGSLIITVECSSSQILEELWEDYCTGHLNEMMQEFLVTEELLKELGLIEVKLALTISEEEYRACREDFLYMPGKFGTILYLLYPVNKI